MTAHLSRRSLLRAAPALAVPVTLTAPLPAQAATDPLPLLMAQRKAAEERWLALSGNDEAPEERAAWAEFRRLEDLSEETAPTSPEGVAAQIEFIKASYGNGQGTAVSDVPVALLDRLAAAVKEFRQ